MKVKNMTTLLLRHSVNRPPSRRGVLLITLALVSFALSPMARAQLNPPPDGGYPGNNTAEGDSALASLTSTTESGIDNTAIGFEALFGNTTGASNTASGSFALSANTTGENNTANGAFALKSNTTAIDNTAEGVAALLNNTTGSDNTAIGFNALAFNTTGGANTANGSGALFGNTTGFENTANGLVALTRNTSGSNNTANGSGALFANTTGGFNTATGVNALSSNTTGKSNIALGASSGAKLTTGSNNIDIGNVGSAGESSRIRVGTVGTHTATFIAGIHGVTVASGVGVIVGVNGHLGTVTSSARFKEAIKPMDKASEAILALKPVTFRYKHELDPDGIPQFGLVAEQVEKVNPDLVARDADGKVNTVRYEAVNAMLLNEFLKEHRKVREQGCKLQEQGATISQLKSTVAQQQKDFEATAARQQEQIETLSAGLQKVSDRLEASRPAPQLVVNN
jgi:hypothetical protein